MLRAPEQRVHLRRLRSLASSYRRQERWMSTALRELQQRLEETHRATFVSQLDGVPEAEAMVARCQDLQLEYDELATQLVHVRMAIAGADEELESHEQGAAAPRRQPA
ncbi:MAG: hypothetical protein R3F29_11975 [Planctomycetota bacterium]